MSTSDYQKKSIKEKEFANRQHGLPNRCHECDMAVPPEDVPAHIDRCEGRAPPHPNARWVAFKQAMKMGVSKKDLLELADAGIFRTKGEKGRRRYLMRDIAKYLQAKASKASIAKAKREAKELTKATKAGGNKAMEKKKTLKVRVAAFVEEVGSFAQAARTLDIPAQTLQRAAAGEKIRKGTQVLIEGCLTEAGA